MHSYLEANGSEHVDLFIISNASKLGNIGENVYHFTCRPLKQLFCRFRPRF